MSDNMILYALTFLAVMLPAVWYVFFHGDGGRPRARNRHTERQPLLFRLCAGPVRLLNAVGVGALAGRFFPARNRAMRKSLQYAGLELTPEQVHATRIFLVVMLAAVAGGLAYLLMSDEDQQLSALVAALIGGFVAWFLPGVVIGNREQERRSGILRALPYSIDLIASAMRGGLDFTAAIRFYVHLGIAGPLTEEYSTMLREMELGVIRTAALQNMADRIRIKEFTSFAAAVVMGSELGASLAETMEIQSEEMRKLRFSIAECKAQRAPSLMLLPMALFILPAVFIIILTPIFLKMR